MVVSWRIVAFLLSVNPCVSCCRVENFEGKYSLKIADATLDDGATYAMKYEEASTSATLTVKGTA